MSRVNSEFDQITGTWTSKHLWESFVIQLNKMLGRPDMTLNQRAIRPGRNGTADTWMTKVACGLAGFRSPLSKQHMHVYAEAEKVRFRFGVWEGWPMVSKMLRFPTREFVRMLKSEVTI